MIKQGAIATAAFDALNRTIDSIAKLQYFSYCKSSPYREIPYYLSYPFRCHQLYTARASERLA
jgi:hypothetical protein